MRTLATIALFVVAHGAVVVHGVTLHRRIARWEREQPRELNSLDVPPDRAAHPCRPSDARHSAAATVCTMEEDAPTVDPADMIDAMESPSTLGCREEPCRTCPYRRDVPSGLWHPDEYAKLVDYDTDTWAQPPAVFLCHYSDLDHPDGEVVCRGWLAVGGWELLGARLAVAGRRLDPDEIDRPVTTALWPTGTDAAAWGMAEVAAPSQRAQAAGGRIEAHRRRTTAVVEPDEANTMD